MAIMCMCYYVFTCLMNDIDIGNLDTLKTVIDELDCTCITIVGDWNSYISDGASLFGNHVR